jgi:hypothetical protein
LFDSVKQCFFVVDLTISQALVEGRALQQNNETKYEGRSTQYLLLLGDDQRDILTYNQVFALYLIDIADILQQD